MSEGPLRGGSLGKRDRHVSRHSAVLGSIQALEARWCEQSTVSLWPTLVAPPEQSTQPPRRCLHATIMNGY